MNQVIALHGFVDLPRQSGESARGLRPLLAAAALCFAIVVGIGAMDISAAAKVGLSAPRSTHHHHHLAAGHGGHIPSSNE